MHDFPIMALYQSNRVFLDSISMIITEQCTLKCEKCAIMLPYFKKAEQYPRWSRAASFIYCGLRNGYGYRDTVQDIQGVIHLEPEAAAEKLDLEMGELAVPELFQGLQFPFTDRLRVLCSPPRWTTAVDCPW